MNRNCMHEVYTYYHGYRYAVLKQSNQVELAFAVILLRISIWLHHDEFTLAWLKLYPQV